MTDLLKAVDPCSTKESGIPDSLPKWGKDIVRILLRNGKMKHQDVKLALDGLPESYSHIRQIFKTRDAKNFFDNEIINDRSYYSLRDPSRFK